MISSDYLKLLEGLFEGIYIVDKHRKIIFWNKGSEHITGYSQDEVINHFCYQNILKHVDDKGTELCKNGCPLHHTLQTGESLNNRVFLHHKDGHRVPIEVRTIPIYDDEGKVVAAIEAFSDSDHRKNILVENKRLQEIIITDELTQVYNRRYIDFQLKNFMNEAIEFEQSFGLIFVDIDNFKQVNDTYGHNTGDEVLKLVARTIHSNLRSNDILGRWGGEEFIVIGKVKDESELLILAEKIRILIDKSSVKLENHLDLGVTISLGATMYRNNDLVTQIVERADKAMYQSKQTGKNKVTIY